MNTESNLLDGFAETAKASFYYTECAAKAEEEGETGAAKLFRAVAAANRIFAQLHLFNLGKVGTTEENLKNAQLDENAQYSEKYAEFVQTAKMEKHSHALRTFMLTKSAKKMYASLYEKALESLEEKQELDYFVCRFCGNLAEGMLPVFCPVCGKEAETVFEKVD